MKIEMDTDKPGRCQKCGSYPVVSRHLDHEWKPIGAYRVMCENRNCTSPMAVHEKRWKAVLIWNAMNRKSRKEQE